MSDTPAPFFLRCLTVRDLRAFLAAHPGLADSTPLTSGRSDASEFASCTLELKLVTLQDVDGNPTQPAVYLDTGSEAAEY